MQPTDHHDEKKFARIISVACMACSLMITLPGCAATLIAGVPDIFLTEVAPRAYNGKGLAEDVADQATGKDCRVIESTVRKDRKICETNNSPETKKDFKGLSGAADNQASSANSSNVTAYPSQPR